jgi:hypothetical protein
LEWLLTFRFYLKVLIFLNLEINSSQVLLKSSDIPEFRHKQQSGFTEKF